MGGGRNDTKEGEVLGEAQRGRRGKEFGLTGNGGRSEEGLLKLGEEYKGFAEVGRRAPGGTESGGKLGGRGKPEGDKGLLIALNRVRGEGKRNRQVVRKVEAGALKRGADIRGVMEDTSGRSREGAERESRRNIEAIEAGGVGERARGVVSNMEVSMFVMRDL